MRFEARPREASEITPIPWGHGGSSFRAPARALLREGTWDKRIGLLGIGAFALVSSLALVVDALVITDEERLDMFVDGLTDTRTEARSTRRLATSIPAGFRSRSMVGDESAFYGDGDEVDLAEHTREALSSLAHGEAELVQKTIDIEGDQARVAVRVSTDDGMVNAQFRFVRRGDGWLVSRMRVL